MESTGTLIIQTITGGGAYPVEGANVLIEGANDENREVRFSVLTDRNGKTPAISLPAPALSYSLTPDGDTVPYSLYNIDVYKDGFYRKKILSVSVFPGISAVLPVNLIPDIPGKSAPQGNSALLIEEEQ